VRNLNGVYRLETIAVLWLASAGAVIGQDQF